MSNLMTNFYCKYHSTNRFDSNQSSKITESMSALEVQVWYKKRSLLKKEKQFLGEINIPLYYLISTEIDQDWFTLKVFEFLNKLNTLKVHEYRSFYAKRIWNI